jgi:two-component system chemotaxis response regulator CheB
MTTTTAHDIVVIGASAGGVEALMRVVAGLPDAYSGTVFVVLHLPPEAPSALAHILNRAGPLSATQAHHKEPIEAGHVYVAPPNLHLLLHRGHIVLEAGPRENNARPSVDVLFRSAARSYGRRVIGVVLSGTLRDGALGLAAIKMRGGVTVVQDPEEAPFAGMPQNAINTTEIDFCLSAADIPLRLDELSQHTFEPQPMQPSESFESDVTIHAADEPDNQSSPKLANASSGLTCPECHGSLWELDDSGSLRYECRIGHAYSIAALLAHQGESVEAALWSAVNSLQERAATFRRLAESGSGNVTEPRYRERAQLIEGHADTLLHLLRGLIGDDQVG